MSIHTSAKAGRQLDRSAELFARAQKSIPGGVNSPVRSFGAVGGTPIFIEKAKGCRVTDVDGNDYIDYLASWGPLILGHADPRVVHLMEREIRRGTSYGCPTELEVDLAELVCQFVPSVESIRMVNSGTEASMSALRLARGVTGRNKIIKIEGCYHGHVDSMLAKAGSGLATLGIPGTPGVTEGTTADTVLIPYNNLDAAEKALAAHENEVAALIVEPIAGNMGMIPPLEGYLQGLRDLTERFGALLIFDEVISGFRVHIGGAQALYGVTPDLTMFGKIIGGGMPVGAYGGRRDLIESMAPVGDIYQAGTLSGNPLAMTAGLATLQILQDESIYAELDRKSQMLAEGLGSAASEAGVPICQTRVGSMSGLLFQEGPVSDYEGALRSDTDRYAKFFHGMLAEGHYFAPSQFETTFVSVAHSEAEIEQTINAARKVMKSL